MLKDDPRHPKNQQLEKDLQFMLSNIRARQNTLMFYLQRYKNCILRDSSDFKLAKNQFQQKQKIYTRQVISILQKHSQFSFGNLYEVRAFWIKLKTIVKVSIERIVSLRIPLVEKLQQCNEKAADVVQRNSDSQKSLIAYRQVENYLKKRTIEALLLGKQTVSPSVSYSESKIQKNRSQTLFKPEAAISRFTINNQESQLFGKAQTIILASKQRIPRQQYLHGLAEIMERNNTNSQPKIKSLNRIKNRRPDETIKANIMNFIKFEQLGKLKSTSKASEKNIKKQCVFQQRINKHLQRCQQNFQGAFDGKYEVSTLLDKKKTIFQNIYSLYDDLFAKNIPNHKMISKFVFNTTKTNQILYNAYSKKKKINQKKDKQKQKQKSTVDGKQKESSNNQKKNKDKQKEKQLPDQRQKNNSSKQNKQNRKFHPHNLEVINLNTKEKQQVRQKKESQTTAMTSKNHTHHKEFNNEKHEKTQKDKDKPDKDKQKQRKIIRSKTAKIKLNSEIQHPHHHLQLINPNFVIGRHFINQQNGHKTSNKGSLADKIVKTIGA